MENRYKAGWLRTLCVGLTVAGVLLGSALGQDTERHGRKYKAPPVTSHVVVTVLKSVNGKPIRNAAVIFHPIKEGKDEGNLEIKTDEDGKASIDVIPVGSKVRLQVIADGFATYGDDYDVPGATKDIIVKMVRPQAQYSVYKDQNGKPAETKPGVQEPLHPPTGLPDTISPTKPEKSK